MPTYLPARLGISQSEAFAEAAHFGGDEPVFFTLAFYHPAIVDPDTGGEMAVYVVNDLEPLVAILEDDAPLDGSNAVTFQPVPMQITLATETDQARAAEVTLTIGNVSRLLMPHLEAATRSMEPVEVICRIYLASDLSAPHEMPPMRVVLRSATATATAVTAQAGFGDIANRLFPGGGGGGSFDDDDDDDEPCVDIPPPHHDFAADCTFEEEFPRDEELVRRLIWQHAENYELLDFDIYDPGWSAANMPTSWNAKVANLLPVSAFDLGGNGELLLSAGRAADMYLYANDQAGRSYGGSSSLQDATLTTLQSGTQYGLARIYFKVRFARNGSFRFRYVFGSDEYPVTPPAAAPDMMVIAVKGPGDADYVPLSLVPNALGDPACCDTINDTTNDDLYVDNAFENFGYPLMPHPEVHLDGFSVPLQTVPRSFVAGQDYEVKIAVANLVNDDNDAVVAVRLKGVTFSSECTRTLVPTTEVFSEVGSHEWTKPEGAVSVHVIVVGGGGSGGAPQYWRVGTGNGGGGGGGGAYVEQWFDPDDLDATVDIEVGAGGPEITNPVTFFGTPGDPGEASSFGDLVAYGGGGGGASNAPTHGGGGGGDTSAGSTGNSSTGLAGTSSKFPGAGGSNAGSSNGYFGGGMGGESSDGDGGTAIYGGGGGGGGGVQSHTNPDVWSGGGGGAIPRSNQFAAGGVTKGQDGPGITGIAANYCGAGGGGGASGSTTMDGGDGAPGQQPGGGGGGGGGSVWNTPGDGGRGGDGIVVVTSWAYE